MKQTAGLQPEKSSKITAITCIDKRSSGVQSPSLLETCIKLAWNPFGALPPHFGLKMFRCQESCQHRTVPHPKVRLQSLKESISWCIHTTSEATILGRAALAFTKTPACTLRLDVCSTPIWLIIFLECHFAARMVTTPGSHQWIH